MRRVAPPSSVVHVGAGNGVTAAHLWEDLAVERLLLIDADPGKTNGLSTAVGKIRGWSAACALLGGQDGTEAAYHVTSNPSADGRVCVDELRAVWPNLRAVRTQTMPECRLEGLLDARDSLAFPAPNWIFVDCLPALPILEGTGCYLDNLDFVWARVVLDGQTLRIDGGTLGQLTDFLAGHGFRTVEVIEGLHPALGDAFFVRDWRALLEPQVWAFKEENSHLTRRQEQATALATHRQRQIEELTEARDAQAELVDEHVAQVEQLIRQHQAAVAQLTQERDDQRRLASDLRSQLCSLTVLSDGQSHVTPASRPELVNFTPFLQLPPRPDSDLDGHVPEFEGRQRRMDEELIRAEAQIDLIKDILLGEPRS